MLMEALHSTKNIPGLVKDISASPTCRIATGPRQGRTMFMWQTRPARGRQALRSEIEPMKKIARQLRRHRPLLLNWFRAKGQFFSGIVEGFNNKAKVTTRKAYGFRTYRATEIALYHALGDLPVPRVTHKFFLTRHCSLELKLYAQLERARQALV